MTQEPDRREVRFESSMIEQATRVLQRPMFPTGLAHVPFRGRSIGLKLEMLLPTRNFKLRGTINAIAASLGGSRRPRGFITATSGNQGVSLSYAAAQMGVRALVVVTPNAPEHKLREIRRWGGEIIIHGNDTLEGEVFAATVQDAEGLVLLTCCNTASMIAGYGTIATEVLYQWPDVSMILVPVGGGALLGGLGFVFAQFAPHVKVVGVQSKCTPVMYNFLYNTHYAESTTICDALAGPIQVESLATDLCQHYAHSVVLVEESAIYEAIQWCLQNRGIVVEPSSASTIAALLSDAVDWHSENVVAVLSGGNADPSLVRSML